MIKATDSKMLIPLARDFAIKMHAHRITTTVSGLKRPQAMHLQEVADLVWASGGTDEEIAAAWLHDIVEDTSVTLDEIMEKFGKEVRDMVEGLTDPKEFETLPLRERKQSQAQRITSKGPGVRRIKIADQTSNVRGLALDPTITMTPLECKEYVEGAKGIVDNCTGISTLLEKLFEEVYRLGKERYRSIK